MRSYLASSLETLDLSGGAPGGESRDVEGCHSFLPSDVPKGTVIVKSKPMGCLEQLWWEWPRVTLVLQPCLQKPLMMTCLKIRCLRRFQKAFWLCYSNNCFVVYSVLIMAFHLKISLQIKPQSDCRSVARQQSQLHCSYSTCMPEPQIERCLGPFAWGSQNKWWMNPSHWSQWQKLDLKRWTTVYSFWKGFISLLCKKRQTFYDVDVWCGAKCPLFRLVWEAGANNISQVDRHYLELFKASF